MATRYPSMARRKQVAVQRDKEMKAALAGAASFVQADDEREFRSMVRRIVDVRQVIHLHVDCKECGPVAELVEFEEHSGGELIFAAQRVQDAHYIEKHTKGDSDV